MKTSTLDVFEMLSRDLQHVDDRVTRAATIGIPAVAALVRDVVHTGGKRLRPAVLLLSARSFTYDLERLATAAAGVELLHTASLIHDDSIDRAGLRRGQPTLNSKLSSAAVILIGDYLFAQSAILAAATNDTRVVSVFASTLGEICSGQIAEMFDAHRPDQTREEYERRIYGKTASLFAGSAEMGAILGEAPEHTIEELRGYGGDIGMAFQIIDDVLDLRESTEMIGKPAGNDLRQGTVTLPVMRYWATLEPGSGEESRLRDVVSGELADAAAIDETILAIRRSGAIEESIGMAHEFVERAKARLNVVTDVDTRHYMEEIADFVLARTV